MKKAIYIVFIILIIITICVTEQIFAQKYIHQLEDKTNEISQRFEAGENVDSQNMQDLTKEAKDFWLEKERYLCTFINHKDIEELGVELNKLATASQKGDEDLFAESLNLLVFYIVGYQHIVGINAQNIF